MSEVPPPKAPAAVVLEIGERLVEAPSRDLTTIAFAPRTKGTAGACAGNRLGRSRSCSIPRQGRTYSVRERALPYRGAVGTLDRAIFVRSESGIRRSLYKSRSVARPTHPGRWLARLGSGPARSADDGLSSRALQRIACPRRGLDGLCRELVRRLLALPRKSGARLYLSASSAADDVWTLSAIFRMASATRPRSL